MESNEKKNNVTELNEEQLEQVSGGVKKNFDGTYTFKVGDTLVKGATTYTVPQNHNNVGASEIITVEVKNKYSAGIATNYFTAEELFEMWQDAGAGSTPIDTPFSPFSN